MATTASWQAQERWAQELEPWQGHYRNNKPSSCVASVDAATTCWAKPTSTKEWAMNNNGRLGGPMNKAALIAITLLFAWMVGTVVAGMRSGDPFWSRSKPEPVQPRDADGLKNDYARSLLPHLGGLSYNTIAHPSWGPEIGKRTTTTADGVHEVWYYEGGRYLAFTNNILVTIQE
jgi:hypothetical protein